MNNIESSYSYIQTRGEERELAENAIKAGYDTIACVGGSGTIHNVLQGLVGTDVSLCIFPTGVSNGFANYLGIKQNNKLFAKTIIDNKSKKVDVGRIVSADNKIYFLAYTCVGSSAQFAKRIEGKAFHNRYNYLLNSVIAVLKFQPKNISLKFTYFNESYPFKEIFVGNIPSYGGQLGKQDIKNVDSGEFRIQVWRTFSLFRFFEFIFKYALSFEDNFYDVHETYTSSQLHFYFPEETYLHADYESYKLQGDVDIDNLHQELKLLVLQS